MPCSLSPKIVTVEQMSGLTYRPLWSMEWIHCGKNSIIFLDMDPEPDDFQNLVVNFFSISGKIFHEVSFRSIYTSC